MTLPSPAVTALFGAGLLASLGTCLLGYYSYRTWNEPGVRPFAAFTVLLGAGGLVGGLGSLLRGSEIAGIAVPAFDQVSVWPQVALLSLLIWSVPWALFGLRYTGRYTRIRPRTLGLYLLPIALVLPLVGVQMSTDADISLLTQLFGALMFLYVSFLLALGVYLILQTSYTYGHLSMRHGAAIAVVPVAHFLFVNTANNPTVVNTTEGVATMYLLAFLAPLTVLGIALTRYGTFDSTPAVGAVGERAIARETDDLIFVIDREERVIKLNETASETLDTPKSDALGGPLPEVTGHRTGELRERGTVTLETTDGTRQYDSQVSTLTDQHDRELGAIVSLRDVSDREIRKQRLEVLNRVLRHNLRNKLSVIQSNAEHVAEEMSDGELESHLRTTVESADALAAFGAKAKRIEELLADDREDREVAVPAFAEEVARACREEWGDATFVVAEATDATVETDPAVLRFVVDTLAENGVTHSDREQPRVELRFVVGDAADTCPFAIEVADDGPGIPDAEVQVIRRGSETPLEHGSGLGLWVVNWAVTDRGGEVSFREREPRGSVVRVELPARVVESGTESVTA